MKRLALPAALITASWVLISAPPVMAVCSDVPAPDVYWRRCVFDWQDLESVDLTGATIRDSSFKRSDFTQSILAEVDARRTLFVAAVMRDAILDGANLVRADLTNADLTGASLKGADLTQARLFQANFSDADLSGARLNDADLLETIFDGATWVDGVTICAQGSIGRCQRSRTKTEPGASVMDAEPPA